MDLLRKLLFVLPLMVNAAYGTDSAASNAPKPSESFEGEIKAGETFSHKLKSGMIFQLQPTRGGHYRIWVGDPSKPLEDYCMSVTPPFRGPNPLAIGGLEVESDDYAREHNLPGHERSFKCVMDRASYQEATWALQHSHWPDTEPKGTLEKAERLFDHYQKMATGGELKVQDVHIANRADEHPTINYLKFEVQFFPPPGEASPGSGNAARPGSSSP